LSTLEAAFLGGLGEERAAFRTLYRIDMWKRQCGVEAQLRGARLVWTVLSEKNAQWGWDLRLGWTDGVKVASVLGPHADRLGWLSGSSLRRPPWDHESAATW
jgi:hypothetical protein